MSITAAVDQLFNGSKPAKINLKQLIEFFKNFYIPAALLLSSSLASHSSAFAALLSNCSHHF
jgi:hypothetical protein